jgi:hypothetical protein
MKKFTLLKEAIENRDGWINEWPKEAGSYWFFGKLSIHSKKELQYVKVKDVGNKLVCYANGAFIWESECVEFWFKPIVLPDTSML